MNSQPNEIIKHILSYVDNHTLHIARRTNHRWKQLIEEIFFKKVVPPLHTCILYRDYYHFGKYYLNYPYDPMWISICHTAVNENNYYASLAEFVKDIWFQKQIPFYQYSENISKEVILIYGARKGHLDIVQYLITQGVDIHAGNDSALQLSASHGYLDVVKFLVNKGANVHAEHDHTLCLSVQKGHLDVVKYLISVGANIHADGECALVLSVQHGHLDIVKYLVGKGADIRILNNWMLIGADPRLIEFLNSVPRKNLHITHYDNLIGPS